MIKKADLRSEFERIVTTLKSYRFNDYFKTLPIETFRLDITESSSGSCFITLAAIGACIDSMRPFAVVARSYPFRSYKSAYQTLVRL